MVHGDEHTIATEYIKPMVVITIHNHHSHKRSSHALAFPFGQWIALKLS